MNHPTQTESPWRDALAWHAPMSPAGRLSHDPHLVVAVLAAVPVWLALGLWASQAMQGPSGWRAALTFALVMPLLEELVFRGLLQGQLLRATALHGQPRRVGPVTWANGLSTLAFVALHLPTQPFLWALAIAVPSLIFGHLRERFDSVWPAVGVHALYNAGFALTAVLSKA